MCWSGAEEQFLNRAKDKESITYKIPIFVGSVLCWDLYLQISWQLDQRNVAACAVDLAHTQRTAQTPALNNFNLPHQTCSWISANQVQFGSVTASVLCLCMPCSVGILPPTAGSCSTPLAHISTPAPLCCAWFILVPLPPTQTQQPTSWSASADQRSALLLDDCGRDDWLKQSQVTARQDSLWVFDVRSPPLVSWEWICSASFQTGPWGGLSLNQLDRWFFVGLHSSVRLWKRHYITQPEEVAQAVHQ